MRAVLPQATALSFPFTVREIVKLGAHRRPVGRAAPARTSDCPSGRWRASISRVLPGASTRNCRAASSSGCSLPACFARSGRRCWTGKPRYLFLDEPVSSLDIKHQLIIMNIARDFAQRGGGVVAILHDLNLTAMYADRICVMHQGRLAAAGTPR